MATTHDWQPPAHDQVRERSSNSSTRAISDRRFGRSQARGLRKTRSVLAEVGNSPQRIHGRLAELDREWHLDRALMLLFSGLGSLTAGLGMRSFYRDRKPGPFTYIFATQMAFLAHHALRGWCPPVELLRRLGFRTAREISAEREILVRRLRENATGRD